MGSCRFEVERYPLSKYDEALIKNMGTQRSIFTSKTICDLIQFALDILPGMYCPKEKLFCFERRVDGKKIGISTRYTLICLIGLHRARAAGYRSSFNLDLSYDAVGMRPLPTVADKGLFLWAGTLLGKDLEDLYQRLSVQLEAEILDLSGMDLGLALSGLVAYASLGRSEEALHLAERLKSFILRSCLHSESHLFYHRGRAGFRKHLPNLATQIYLMYALAQYAVLAKDEEAGNIAALCGQTLCLFQRSDGGWPWIYHSRGRVVEDYEIYSVHQDAMMPMALLEIEESTSSIFRDSIGLGLGWLFGGNDLQVEMIDSDAKIINRSIRRHFPLDRIVLGINATSSSLLKRSFLHNAGIGLEVNRTCRPYHPGWILQAWCGRETVLSEYG